MYIYVCMCSIEKGRLKVLKKLKQNFPKNKIKNKNKQ